MQSSEEKRVGEITPTTDWRELKQEITFGLAGTRRSGGTKASVAKVLIREGIHAA